MRRTISFAAVCLLAFSSAAHAELIRGPGAPPIPLTDTNNPARQSDLNPSGAFQTATTGFNLAPGQDFLRLSFWGVLTTNTSPNPAQDDFRIRIWGPASAPQDEAAALYDVSVTPSRSLYYNAIPGTTNPTFEYSVNFASPLAITTSGTYFLSVVRETNNALSDWAWTSYDNSGDRYRRSGESGTWFSITGGGQMAFQSAHAPEPGSIGVLSVAALGMLYGGWRRRKKHQQPTA